MRKRQLITYYDGNDRSMPNGDSTVFGLPCRAFDSIEESRLFCMGQAQKKFYPELPGAAGKGRGRRPSVGSHLGRGNERCQYRLENGEDVALAGASPLLPVPSLRGPFRLPAALAQARLRVKPQAIDIECFLTKIGRRPRGFFADSP